MKFDVWIYNFTWKHLNLWWSILCSLWITNFYTFILYRPWPPLASHRSPPLLFLKNKKTSRNKSQKVFWIKTSTCRDGTLKNQPNKMGMTNTFTPSLHLVPFCQLCTPQSRYMHITYSYSHPLNEHGTQHCSFHSLLHKRQSISAMFSSNTNS